MKLYTRNGDKGTTSLYNGEKVGKSSDKIRLLAEIDHFISLYGSNFSDDIEILIALKSDISIAWLERLNKPCEDVPPNDIIFKKIIYNFLVESLKSKV